MRSLLKVLFLTLTLIISMFTVSHASLYPDYLGGDTNFVLVDGHMGRAWYIDRSSLNVQKYAPPQYIISVNTAVVENADKGNITISNIKNLRFFYNSDLGKMYYDSIGNDSWVYIKPISPWANYGSIRPAAEMAFAMAYHMKFYSLYDDDFYIRGISAH